MVHHGRHKGTRQDAARNEGWQSHSDSGAQSQAPNGDPCGRLPPGVIREIASQRSSNGGTKLPVKRGKQIMIQDVPVDAHVIQKLGGLALDTSLLSFSLFVGPILEFLWRGDFAVVEV